MRLHGNFRGFWVSGGCQGKVKPPRAKNEPSRSFLGVVGSGLWWSQGKVKPPENEPSHSFSRVVSCGVWWVRTPTQTQPA